MSNFTTQTCFGAISKQNILLNKNLKCSVFQKLVYENVLQYLKKVSMIWIVSTMWLLIMCFCCRIFDSRSTSKRIHCGSTKSIDKRGKRSAEDKIITYILKI